MGWEQVLTLIGINIAFISVMVGLVIWAVNKLDGDIRSLDTNIKSIANRLDGHAVRIDQLYEIIIELIKEGKK